MLHEEIDISDSKYQIKASLKTPDNPNSKTGIILVHGGFVNRHSLSRTTYSFSEYLCKELEAYVITPDLLGETIYKNPAKFSDSSEIINITTNYLTEEYDIDEVMGFAYSQGSYSLAQSLQNNDKFKSIVVYGGFIIGLEKISKNTFIKSLIKHISFIKPSINVKKLFKYIYDKETCNYLLNVMIKNERFGYMNYNYDFDLKIIIDLLDISNEYINLIKKWGKPALLLYGNQDTLNDKTRSYYYDGYVDDNITVKHIPELAHITPCVESPHQLSKLYPVIQFYKNQVNDKIFNIRDIRIQNESDPLYQF